MKHTVSLSLLTLLLLTAAFAQTDPTPTQGLLQDPQWILMSGVSFNAIGPQISNVSTAAFRIGSIAGRPTYQQLTIETAMLSRASGVWQYSNATAGALRTDTCQVAYQTASKIVALGGCGGIGFIKEGDLATLGSPSGSAFLSIDIGAKLSKGKFHAFITPTYRIIAISGQQIQGSPALRIGTGF